MECDCRVRKRMKRNGQTIGDRYVFNIFATLGPASFVCAKTITVPAALAHNFWLLVSSPRAELWKNI